LESLVFLFRQVFGGHEEIAFLITPIFIFSQASFSSLGIPYFFFHMLVIF